MEFLWPLIRLLTSLVSLLKTVFRRLRGQNLSFPNCPPNILLFAMPGMSVDHLAARLGTPPIVDDQDLKIFRFSNATLHLQTTDTKISTATLLVRRAIGRKNFDLPFHKMKLGGLRIGDVCEDLSEVTTDSSSKFRALWVEKYYGNPKGYFWYSYGVWDGPGALNSASSPRFKGILPAGASPNLLINICSVSDSPGVGAYFSFWRDAVGS